MKRKTEKRASAKSEIKGHCRPEEECRVGIGCVVTMMTIIISIRGNESGAASGREHGGAARNKTMFGGPSKLWELPAVPCSFADGHTVSNAPDLFRPPKLSGTGPG
jgi:hypothetical protein